MRKLDLSLDGVAVESFVITPERPVDARGTLHANEVSGAGCPTRSYGCLTSEGCYSFSVSCALPVCPR